MTTAQQILIAYGTIVLLLGFSLGGILGMLRTKTAAIRSLATAHVETLMQSAMHFGLAYAVAATGYDSSVATWGAVLLVIGSAMQAIGATLNWITKAGDQFAERSPGFWLNSASSLAIWPGVLILAIGILTNL